MIYDFTGEGVIGRTSSFTKTEIEMYLIIFRNSSSPKFESSKQARKFHGHIRL
jgi:hypothetical protein